MKSAGKTGKSGGGVTRTLGSIAELGKVGAVDAAFSTCNSTPPISRHWSR